MIFQIIEENGVKKIKALTADTGAGAPVGTLISQYKKVPMSGYLYCDGSTFDETAYPALYLYLGTNVLPDYRECVMVGAEQNTTDAIAEHDVYTQGQFKDDQLQEHKHVVNLQYPNGGGSGDTDSWALSQNTNTAGYWQNSTDRFVSATGRTGTTTHGKQKAVYVYIKATSGLTENQQENVLNAVKDYVDNSNSYSTDEILTGGKWIDGKPIYRKVIDCGAMPNNTTKNVAHGISNIGKVVRSEGYSNNNAGSQIPVPYVSDIPLSIWVNNTNIVIQTSGDYTAYVNTYITLEYTKTTD